LKNDIRLTWDSLSTPTVEQQLSAKRVSSTNCWIFKSPDESLGFLMTNVHEPLRYPELKNIDFLYVPIKILHYNGRNIELSRCLEIHLDPECDSELLAMVFDRMEDFQPNGKYTSELMIKTLNNAINLLQRPKRPPSKQEVIGAWGELLVLYSLIQASSHHTEIIRMINGWESEGGQRDIIDFRLPFFEGGTVNEVKTSSVSREHYIHGLNQLIIPEGFEKGWLTSILIRETDGSTGLTCLGLLEKIFNLFSGSEDEIIQQITTLEFKIENRGAACRDSRYYFMLTNDSLRKIKMDEVPIPTGSSEIKEIEWLVDVSNIEFDSIEINL
jgi:hypothetical protein